MSHRVINVIILTNIHKQFGTRKQREKQVKGLKFTFYRYRQFTLNYLIKVGLKFLT